MIRKAVITGGVAYHHGLTQHGEVLGDFEVIDVGRMASVEINDFDLLVVPRSTDGDALYARRYQIARFLDQGGVLIALGELWANWFPGCRWEEECPEDTLEPVIVANHPLTAGFSASDLHWHPSRERWCCHGHLVAPPGADVLVGNARGDAWLYVDRATTNGVIVASTNLDPDTHTFHGKAIARRFFGRLLAWASAEAAANHRRPARERRKIAGLYSGVHFQRAFYEDPEFRESFVILPVWELDATRLDDYAALWIPRESNQGALMRNRAKLARYLQAGGTIVCWDEVNQPWLPAGQWELKHANLDTIRLAPHPMLAPLTVDQVRWHSHGVYRAYDNAQVLIDDGQGGVMLFLDERTFSGRLLAGTMDPDCHAGFGNEATRPLLRAILSWIKGTPQVTAESVATLAPAATS